MKNNNKGFTMAEMLIVVAIIAVLVAIAIPTFVGQLSKTQKTADLANIRSAYSEAASDYLLNPENDTVTITGVKLVSTGALDVADTVNLPFDLPDDFSITKGTYSITFDFSEDRATSAFSRTGD